MALRVPFVDLSRLVSRVRGDVLEAWAACLDEHAFVGGPRARAFEAKVEAATGAPHVVSCASGTDALIVALQVAGVRSGHRVAMPNLTFWATFEAVAQLGAVPVLVDVDPDDLQASLGELRSAHEAHHLQAAILVHLYGWASKRLGEIRAFCREAGIPLVEDAAQAFGVRVGGQPILAGAESAALSFYPSKVVGGAMDGGAIATASAERAERVRALCDHGRTGHYEHAHVGWNSRMGAIQAAYLSRVLDELPAILASRREGAAWYRRRLAGERRIRVYGPPPGVEENGYLSVVTVEGRSGASIAAALEQAGIGCARTYPAPLDAQAPASAAGAIAHGDLSCSRRFCGQVVNLPLFYGIREDELELVAQALLGAAR